MSKLSNFYANVAANGVRYAYQYRASVVGLPVLSDVQSQTNAREVFADPASANDKGAPNFSFYCQSTSLPGRTVTQSTVSWLGMSFQVPNGMTYTHSMNLRVTCDPKMQLREAFEAWMDVYGSSTAVGGGAKRLPSEDVKLVLEMTNEKTNDPDGSVYELVGCWPSVIGDMEFGQGSSELATVPITITYQYYRKRPQKSLVTSAQGQSFVGDAISTNSTTA